MFRKLIATDPQQNNIPSPRGLEAIFFAHGAQTMLGWFGVDMAFPGQWVSLPARSRP